MRSSRSAVSISQPLSTKSPGDETPAAGRLAADPQRSLVATDRGGAGAASDARIYSRPWGFSPAAIEVREPPEPRLPTPQRNAFVLTELLAQVRAAIPAGKTIAVVQVLSPGETFYVGDRVRVLKSPQGTARGVR